MASGTAIGARFSQARPKRGAHFLVADRAIEAALADGGGNAASRTDAEIGANEGVFEFLDRGVVEPALADEVRNGGAERIPAAAQAAAQPPPPVAGLLRRVGPVIHVGRRDTRFAMAVKEITPEEMLARVLHRDGLMLIIDKPAGLAVHRGPKGGASLEDYFDALRYGLPRPPSLAHRLDKDTSGCLVLGRHRKALAHLGLLFKHGKVAKTYWAVVAGGPDANEGMIDLPLGRLDATRGWWMKPDPKGLPSVTTWTAGRSVSPPGWGRCPARKGRGGGVWRL
jgi:hypothetical protein